MIFRKGAASLVVTGVGLLALHNGCSGGLVLEVRENTRAACIDRLDNDGDGRVDCDDPDCQDLVVCAAASPAPTGTPAPTPNTPPGPTSTTTPAPTPTPTCSSCDDRLTCTTDTCNAQSGACENAVKPGMCLVDGVCHSAGTRNGVACELCDPSVSKTAWAPIVGGCTIGSQCYRKGERDLTGCLVCDPSRSATDWSPFLSPACTVVGKCYAAGETDATHCNACVPSFSVTALQPATYACNIGGKCFQEGENHPSQTCNTVTCSKAQSSGAWTVAGNECLVGNQCFGANEKDVTGCKQCDPSQSRVALTPAPHACEIANLCYAQSDKHPSPTCASTICDGAKSSNWTTTGNECLIGGACRQAGDKTANGCSECNPARSKTSWSALGCMNNETCYAFGSAHPSATCNSYSVTCDAVTALWIVNANACLINGQCYANGASDPTGCSTCNTAISTTAWTATSGCTNIVVAALNEVHDGDLDGIGAADALCASQAAAAGRGGSWKSFLSSTTQNVSTLIKGNDASSKPVVNMLNEPMYASWNSIFSGTQWSANTSNLYSFDEKKVLAHSWTGSSTSGAVTGGTCLDWTNRANIVFGTYGRPALRYLLFPNFGADCSQKLAVACVSIPSP